MSATGPEPAGTSQLVLRTKKVEDLCTTVFSVNGHTCFKCRKMFKSLSTYTTLTIKFSLRRTFLLLYPPTSTICIHQIHVSTFLNTHLKRHHVVFMNCENLTQTVHCLRHTLTLTILATFFILIPN